MEETFTLKGDDKFLVIGPAKVRVLSGKVEVFGKEVRRGEEFIVKRYKAFPLEALKTSSKVSITLGMGGKVEEGGRIGCGFWEDLAKTIREDPRDALILGKVDSGKSSLAVFLVNRCLGKGLRIGVIDADPGQGDIGEPGLIGSAIPGKPILSLEELKPFKTAFIGSTSPMGLEERLERAVAHLFQDLKEKGCEVVLVVLHGWVTGEYAHSHILRLAALLRVGIVVSLGDGELEPLLERFKELEEAGSGLKYLLGVEPDTYKRSLGQRRAIRNRKIRRYFSQTPFYIKHIRHGEIPIHGTKIFQGEMTSLREDVKKYILEVVGGGRGSHIYSEAGKRGTRSW